MKRKGLFLLILAALVFSACQSLFVEDRAGQVIRFSASAGNGMETRTNYSGDKDDVTNKERIDWSDGDRVKVYLYLDNAPGYYWDHTSSDYKVTLIDKGKLNYISKGTLDSVGTSSLKWVGTADDHVAHWFYSIYPADYRGELYKDTDGSMKVDFNGLAEQDGTMNYAYMAAVSGPYEMEDREVRENKVDLDYYPLVTTVYVKVFNNSDKAINIPLRLISKDQNSPLAGPYSVQLLGDNNFVPDEIPNNTFNDDFVWVLEGNASVAAKDNGATFFFLLPQSYSTSELYLAVPKTEGSSEFVEYPLTNKNSTTIPQIIEARSKYNVTLTIKSNGGISVSAARLIVDFLMNGTYEEGMMVSNLWRYFLGYNDFTHDYEAMNWVNANLINSPNGKLYLLQQKINNGTLKEKDFENAFKDLPGVLDTIMNLMGNITQLTLQNRDLDMNLSAEDLLLFPNLKTLELQFNPEGKKVTLEISQHPNLETVAVKGNATVTLDINSCEQLQTVNVKDLNNNKEHVIKINDCKKLTTLEKVQNATQTTYIITNCNSTFNTE